MLLRKTRQFMLCSQNLGKKIKLQYRNKYFSRLLHLIFINIKSKQPISTDNLIIFPSCILDGKYTSDTKYRFSSKNYFRGKWSSVHQYRAKQNLTFFFLKYKTKKLSPRKKGNEKNVKIIYTSELKYLKWQETTHTCTFYTMMWRNEF